MDDLNDKKSSDFINLVLGAWVAVSPWVIGYATHRGAVWSAVILGLVVVAVSAWALYRPMQRVPEWANVVLGILLFIAPWVMGYATLTGAAWNSWAVGVVLVVFAAYAFVPLSHHHGHPAHQ